MRALTIALALVPFLVAGSGCGSSEQHGGGGEQDMSVPVNNAGPDLGKIVTTCDPMDTLTDGQSCSAGCTMDQTGVNFLGACKCFQNCDVNHQATCPCDRFCTMLTNIPDGGTSSGACLPGNGAGERCYHDAAGKSFGNGLCRQGLDCIPTNAPNQPRYCFYICFGSNSQCPAQTECDPLPGTNINVCNPIHGANAKPAGAACVIGTDSCQEGLLCDGTSCKAICDGPNAACATGSCGAITDGTRTVGYVCK